MRVHLIVSTVLSSLIGAGAALLALTAMEGSEHGTRSTEPQHGSASSHSPSIEHRTVVVEGDLTRLSALEREVDQMRSALEANAEEDEVEPLVPTPEEERRQLEQIYATYDQRFESESYDPGWSGQATNHLGTALKGMSEIGEFSVVSAECKSAVCRASLKWGNYDSAVARGARLPEQMIPGLNCTRSMWLKEPQNAQAPYTAELYLDCAEQRAGLAEAIPTTSGDMP